MDHLISFAENCGNLKTVDVEINRKSLSAQKFSTFVDKCGRPLKKLGLERDKQMDLLHFTAHFYNRYVKINCTIYIFELLCNLFASG